MMLKDKVAIVTGAASGIGRAIALQLGKEAADVVVADIDIENATKVVDEIKAMGRRAVAMEVNVTRSEETNRMAKATLDEFGGIDILVNNAGGSAREKNVLFHESKEEVWDWIIGLNLKGTLLCTRAVINHMMQRRSGKIVNLGSMAGIMGRAKMADYSAAKGGVIAFTKALAKEVGSYGITVNCVSPGAIETQAMRQFSADAVAELKRMSYLGILGKPEDIANVVVFLTSDEANFITGQNIPVCGGRNLGV